MTKIHLDYCEFYITNVCNLACDGCNRFNNYSFKGTQKWSDYADVYLKWSEQLKIGNMAILGGEPTINPYFVDWVSGISALWPKANLRIVTNGFYLPKLPDLYKILKMNDRISLSVGIHNKKHKKKIIGIIRNFLYGKLTYEFDNTPYRESLVIADSNNVIVEVEYNWWFHQGSIIKDQEKITLHSSDPVKAHNNCHMKYCHHFIKGKLYKCGVVGLLPEFDEQHRLSLSSEDRLLLNDYKPLSVESSHKRQFVESLNKFIKQCRFCPEIYNGTQLYSQEKKER